MKAVIQRVASASVSVDGELISSIGRGLCVLVGIHRGDTRKELEQIVRKILNLRLFEDPKEEGKRWNKSVKDLKLELLCISQFTLYHTLKGNKPDFHLAMKGDDAKDLYDEFLAELKRQYEEEKVKDGLFGGYMQVSLVNDGPVTLEIEFPPSGEPKSAQVSTVEVSTAEVSNAEMSTVEVSNAENVQ